MRIVCTCNSRINMLVALWAFSKASTQCRNWFYVVNKHFSDLHLNFDLNIYRPVSSGVV